MFVTRHAGIYFVEGQPESFRALEAINSELSDFFSSNQLKSLTDLKAQMADLARQRGGNCIADFRYGQRSSFWKSFLAKDDVIWYGSGTIGVADDSQLAAKVRS